MSELNNSDDKTETNITKQIRPNFPWLSIGSAIVLVALFLITQNQTIIISFELDASWLTDKMILSLCVVFALILALDVRLYLQKRSLIAEQFKRLEQQINLLSQSKKKQQQRANTFSDHSEKLKLFISDRLLEYMEYDEKFIHFKGIASEVRHNGVISYDKVITALSTAIEQQKFLSLYEQNDESDDAPNEHTINALTDYQSAIDAMRYLWDLLDLSTADNMALHIGNQLIDCEELFYQLQLDAEKSLDITQTIPLSPTFYAQTAVLMTFSLISDEPEIRNTIALAKINPAILRSPFYFENEQFRIMLQSVDELLGNQNHIILLLENLIKNAQFFSNKNRYKQKTDRINVSLIQQDNQILLSIYNRGPHIKSELIDEIFKLGFSTRKSKQHHGKGLGLFFASEIVRGYQGSIQATNVHNKDRHYLLTFNLASSESIQHTVYCQFEESRMKIKLKDDSEWLNELILQSDIPICSVGVQQLNNQESDSNSQQLSESIEPVDNFSWVEPSELFQSQWHIEIKPFKNKHKLIFKPLDISGVCFDITLPTANACLSE